MDNPVPTLRAMASNYANGHSWDDLDSAAVVAAADALDRLTQERDKAKADADYCAKSWEREIEANNALRARLKAIAAERDAATARADTLAVALKHQVAAFDEAALDARRYHFLRSRDLETVYDGGIFAGKTPENIVLNSDDLDREIDAALEK